MTRSGFGGVGAALLLTWSAGAYAAPKRIGIPKFDGKQEALIRKAVMQAVQVHDYELVKSREMEGAISSTGAHLDSDDGLKTLAKELALAAIITGEVGPRRAKIVVHDGSEGSVLGDASFAGANPRKLAVEVGRDFWRKLGADVGRGQVPHGAKKAQKAPVADAPEDSEQAPESGDEAPMAEKKASKPKPEPEAASSEEAASEAEKAPPSRRKKPKMENPPEEADEGGTPSSLPWIDVELGAGGLNRSLSFFQQAPLPSPQVLPYSLGLGPLLLGKLVLFPVAPFDGGPLADLGVEVGIEQGIVSSTGAGGTSYSNVVHDFAGGIRYRIPFAGTDQLYFSGTGGEHAFTFNGTNRVSLEIPDTIYRYVRPGFGLRLGLPRGISVSLAAGYRYVFNQAGPQFSGSHFFPHLTVGGADVELGGGYALTPNFEIRLGASWRRYWFSMHSTAADQMAGMPLAGGAVDQYFTITGGIAFLYGTTAAKSEPGAEEAPPPPPPKPTARTRRHHTDSDDESEGEGASDSGGDSSGGKKSGGDDDQ